MTKPLHWLMLRGLVRESRHWGDIAPYFAAHLPAASLHTVDFPGMGSEHHRQSPTTMDEIVDDTRARHLAARHAAGLQAERFGIFAISLGGMVALNWATRYPQDFAYAVVVNTSAGNLSGPFARFSPKNLGKVARAIVTRDNAAREKLLLSFTVNRDDIDLAAIAAQWAALPPASFQTFRRQLWAANRWKLPATIGVPTLVLASRADRLCSYRCGEAIAKHIGAAIALHDTAGHELPRDDGAWCVAQVQQWLAAQAAA